MRDPLSPARALADDPAADVTALRDCLREVTEVAARAMEERERLAADLSEIRGAGSTLSDEDCAHVACLYWGGQPETHLPRNGIGSQAFSTARRASYDQRMRDVAVLQELAQRFRSERHESGGAYEAGKLDGVNEALLDLVAGVVPSKPTGKNAYDKWHLTLAEQVRTEARADRAESEVARLRAALADVRATVQRTCDETAEEQRRIAAKWRSEAREEQARRKGYEVSAICDVRDRLLAALSPAAPAVEFVVHLGEVGPDVRTRERRALYLARRAVATLTPRIEARIRERLTSEGALPATVRHHARASDGKSTTCGAVGEVVLSIDAITCLDCLRLRLAQASDELAERTAPATAAGMGEAVTDQDAEMYLRVYAREGKSVSGMRAALESFAACRSPAPVAVEPIAFDEDALWKRYVAHANQNGSSFRGGHGLLCLAREVAEAAFAAVDAAARKSDWWSRDRFDPTLAEARKALRLSEVEPLADTIKRHRAAEHSTLLQELADALGDRAVNGPFARQLDAVRAMTTDLAAEKSRAEQAEAQVATLTAEVEARRMRIAEADRVIGVLNADLVSAKAQADWAKDWGNGWKSAAERIEQERDAATKRAEEAGEALASARHDMEQLVNMLRPYAGIDGMNDMASPTDIARAVLATLDEKQADALRRSLVPEAVVELVEACRAWHDNSADATHPRTRLQEAICKALVPAEEACGVHRIVYADAPPRRSCGSCGVDLRIHRGECPGRKPAAESALAPPAAEPAVETGAVGVPIPMRLVCPSCGDLHEDVGEFATKVHHTHACQTCGEVWRPAVVATVGVRFLPGFKNDDRDAGGASG